QMTELVEKGYIYIAQPPLYKVKQGKDERYLKDQHELDEYLLQSALKGAELNTGKNDKVLSGEALAEIAKQMVLTEAVIRRLASLYDESVLRALQDLGKIDLSTQASANASAERLRPLLGHTGSEVIVGYDQETAAYRLEVNKFVHGNLQSCIIDPEFMASGDYRQIEKTSTMLEGLLGEGAAIKRGEKQQGVANFKGALDWLLNEAKQNLNIQRYKGLGEMNPGQLWETTMDPAVRRLLKVQIDDAIAADEIFTTLMGDQVEPRRAFIENNALGVNNLDV
ncbi:MAG TPA: DNA gyrase subunit B, partial [Methylophilaceae bacterium]|nr:DNA gyrase subunit B [Methylophilaceae bacterium]